MFVYPPQMSDAIAETYRNIDNVELKIWRFEPRGHGPTDQRPAIVFFFGGGWRMGSPAQFEAQARYLARRGMMALLADYRVSERHQVKANQSLLCNNYHILPLKCQRRLPLPSEPLKGGVREEKDVGPIHFVVPSGEGSAIQSQLCHDTEKATWFETRPQTVKFLLRVMEMFDHLGCGNEIVGTRKHARIWRIKMVI